MWYSFWSYITFIFSATNQHGVHSPFVYNLVTKCFYDNTEYNGYSRLINYKKQLQRNNTFISITDLGPGSKKTNTTKRQVSEIAKTSGSSLKRSKLLFRLLNYFKPQQVLELGTSLGIAIHAMALGNPETTITSIEGCPNLSSFANQQLKDLKNISFLTGDFKTHISQLKSQHYDLIFFDGNHTKEATLHYFNALLPTTNNDSIFIFDDIYWSKGMTEAWKIIQQHPKVTVTIDTYYWGFVFFREEQAKEHFKIRL